MPLSGVPLKKLTSPAVPADTIEYPLSRVRPPPATSLAHSEPDPTEMFAAYWAEHSTALTVKNNFAPATASADPVDVMTSVIALPKTSVPVIVHVLPLSLVAVVVTVTFLAPPPKKVVAAIVADVSGLATVTSRSGSAAFSSEINLTCTSVCIPILASY